MSPPTPPPGFLDRLRRFDPAVLPIVIAGVVLVAAVIWLLGRPLPTGPAPGARVAEDLAALRAQSAEAQSALERRLAALEGGTQRIAALESRPAPDLTPVQREAASAAEAAAAAARRVATVEERLAARPDLDPAALATRQGLDELAARLDRATAEAREAAQRAEAGARQAVEQVARDAATRQATAEQAQAALAARLVAAEQALAARGAAQDAMGQRLGALEQALGARIATVEGQIGSRAQAVEQALGQRIGAAEQALAQRAAALEQQIAQRGTALEQQIAQRGAAIEQQATRIAALEATTQRLAALEARAARLAALDGVRTLMEAGRPLGPALGGLGTAPEALARFATAAPPTEAQLRLSFEEAARAARAASEPARDGGGALDSAMARLSGLVTVRRGEEMLFGDAAQAEIERARRAVEAGDLEASLRHLARLSPPAREAIRGWTSQAEALVAARAALRQIAAG